MPVSSNPRERYLPSVHKLFLIPSLHLLRLTAPTLSSAFSLAPSLACRTKFLWHPLTR